MKLRSRSLLIVSELAADLKYEPLPSVFPGPRPRWHPPNLIQLVLLVDLPVFLLILLVHLLIFWDWIACNCSLYFYNLPWCYYYLHVIFFWRFLESRNHKIQVVAQVGRKSAVELSGIMEASYSHFFIGIDFNCSLLENVEPGKSVLTRLRSPREWKNRTRLDEHYFFYYPIPPEDII